MTDITRRALLKCAITGTVALSGLPLIANAKVNTEVEKMLKGTKDVSGGNQIALDVPVFAESGQTVPVAVTSHIPDTQSIDIIVSENNPPLAVSVNLKSGLLPKIATRVQIDQKTDVIAIVKANGKLYSSKVDVLMRSADGCFGS